MSAQDMHFYLVSYQQTAWVSPWDEEGDGRGQGSNQLWLTNLSVPRPPHSLGQHTTHVFFTNALAHAGGRWPGLQGTGHWRM